MYMKALGQLMDRHGITRVHNLAYSRTLLYFVNLTSNSMTQASIKPKFDCYGESSLTGLKHKFKLVIKLPARQQRLNLEILNTWTMAGNQGW